MFFLIAAMTAGVLCAQSPADPTLDTTGLPWHVRAIPKPQPEPWKKMTGEERFKQYAADTFGPDAFLFSAVGAGMSQWLDSPTEWGQGMEGYGRRYANSYGGTVLRNTMRLGLSAALHEDNRYFRSGKTGAKSRIGYVLLSPIIAKNDQGRNRFSVSHFTSAMGSQAIARYWSPPSWQGLDNVAMGTLIWYCQEVGKNFGREFWPDIARKMRKK